jgi:transcription elongation factor GreA
LETKDNLPLKEAAARFLASLPPEARHKGQSDLSRFVRWFGDRPVGELTALSIEEYAERLSLSDRDYALKLDTVRGFLAYAKKQSWSTTNLATHLKVKKAKMPCRNAAPRQKVETTELTSENYAAIEAELADLKKKRAQLIIDIQKAAADKDFRENAPLAAAREQRSHVEGKIQELEVLLKTSTVVAKGAPKTGLKVASGDTIVLTDLVTGEDTRYILVMPREVNPAQGKISTVSPIGRAVIGRSQGETVEVEAPLGKFCYQIKLVQH